MKTKALGGSYKQMIHIQPHAARGAFLTGMNIIVPPEHHVHSSNIHVMHAPMGLYTAHDAQLASCSTQTTQPPWFALRCITSGHVTNGFRNLPVVMLLHCEQKSCKTPESLVSDEAAAAAVKSFSLATVSLPIAWILLTGSVISGMSGFLTDDLIVVT